MYFKKLKIEIIICKIYYNLGNMEFRNKEFDYKV